jgi:serralysin
VDNLIQFGTGTFNCGNGLGGNDIMIAGSGHDEMLGGSGNATFRFNAPTAPGASGDFIYDFTIGQDHIQLNAGAFGIGTGSNQFVEGVTFITGPGELAPRVAAPTIEYSTTSGLLLYDADGIAASAPVVLAILNGVPVIHASDFMFL